MIITVVFFLVIGFIVISGASFMAAKDIHNMNDLFYGKTSYYVSEAGMEDALYRIKNALLFTGDTMPIDNNFAYVSLTDNGDGTYTVLSQASTSDFYKRVQANVTAATGISFHYGIQAGTGGFSLLNSANIIGNVYSEGTITGAGNYLYGDVISTGVGGSIYGIHATGTVYSHTIGGSQATIIDGDAYYSVATGTLTVGSSTCASNSHCHSGSADQSTTTLPITDQQIQKWESDAASGGTMSTSSCDTWDSRNNICTLSTTRTIGPKKIPFNLEIKAQNTTITVAGALWIVGNLTVSTQPTIQMSASLGSTNIPIIADDPSNPTTSGIVTLGQGSTFSGSGSPNSYVFIISQNKSAENGGSTVAISPGQSSNALVIYASHGLINMTQTVSVRDIVAYKIAMNQSSNVTYDTGLATLIFANGPSTSFSILNWGQI